MGRQGAPSFASSPNRLSRFKKCTPTTPAFSARRYRDSDVCEVENVEEGKTDNNNSNNNNNNSHLNSDHCPRMTRSTSFNQRSTRCWWKDRHCPKHLDNSLHICTESQSKSLTFSSSTGWVLCVWIECRLFWLGGDIAGFIHLEFPNQGWM